MYTSSKIEETKFAVVIRLGGFHTLASFLGAIGYIYGGSGIYELFCTCYGSNTVLHMLTGKAYSKALRAHFLVDAALCYLLLEEFLTADQLLQLKDIFDTGETSEEFMQTLHQSFNEKLEELSACSRTAKLWIQYHKLITTIQLFIRSERLHDWVGHLTAVSQMINIFAAAGRHNYAKSARLYLQDMLDLEGTCPITYKLFKDGKFTVRYKGREWSGIWTDLCIEQTFMKMFKTRGGPTKGRGVTETALTIWVATMSHMAGLNQTMKEFLNSKKKSEAHKDCGNARIKRDHKDFNLILTCLRDNSPLSLDIEDPTSLRSLSSGLTSHSNDINCDNAYEVGVILQRTFDHTSYNDAKLATSKKVATLLTLEKSVQIGEKKLYMDTTALFARLILVQNRMDIKDCFKFEMTQVPTSLFDKGGMMRDGNKADFGKILKGECSISALNLGTPQCIGVCVVVDGGWLVRQVTHWTKGDTFKELAHRYVAFLKKRFGGNIVVVFDDYENGPSTKDHTHKKRAGSKPRPPLVTFTDDTRVNQKSEKFLANPVNKKKLGKFLIKHFVESGIATHQAIEDADTLVVKVAIEKIDESQKVYVVAEDTDVLILLIHHTPLPKAEKIFFSSKGGELSYNIGKIIDALDDVIKDNILVLHAWSGCDTTSGIFGFSKVGLINKITKQPSLLEKLISSDNKEEVVQIGNQLMISTVSGKKSDSLCGLRQRAHNKQVAKGSVKPERLPPSLGATTEHTLRVKYQVEQWSKLDTSINLDPSDWGWVIKNGKLVPVMTKLPVAPKELLKVISCNCKVTKCETTACSCFQNGLKCLEACGYCDDDTCRNKDVTDPVITSEDWDENND